MTIAYNGNYRFTIVRRQKSVDVYFKDISTTPSGVEASFSYSSSTYFGSGQTALHTSVKDTKLDKFIEYLTKACDPRKLIAL